MNFEEWSVKAVDTLGEFGVGLMIFLENVIPPIPSEIILPLAGYFAHNGNLNVVLAWVAATIGSIAGAWFIYGVSAWLGLERLERLSHKKWFILATPQDLRRGERVFEKYGWWVVGFGRCIPFIRSAVSLPAGLTRMRFLPFTLITLLGSGVWNALFIGLGWGLGDNWDVVQNYVGPISRVVVVLVALGLLWLIIRRVRRMRTNPTSI